ncbi:MAG: DUF4013 domain-containing protein [Candidatus Obscuribacterales bacterium]|nr:DUF4013 domain-containing protein [Candidatus Obscuribacterales bacterium]
MNVDSDGLDPNRAFALFFKDPDWKLKAGLGAVLNAGTLSVVASGAVVLPLVPIAFLILAAVQGYTLRVIRNELKSDNLQDKSPELLPKWNEWLDLMISGLTWLAVVCSQWIVIFLIVTGALLIGQHYGALNAQSTSFKPWFLVTSLAVSMSVFFASFFLPLLMVNFAEQEKVTAALAVDEAFARLKRRPLDFLAVWMLNLSLFTLGLIVPTITIFGIFFVPFLQFVIGTINAIMLAQVWKSAKT